MILKTGFKDLDIILSNTENSSLITIGARPAMGKTSFMLCILHNLLKQNKKCLFLSLKMSTQQIIKRFITQMGEIDYCVLTHNEMSQKRKYYKDKITKVLDEIAGFDLTINGEQVSIEEIKEQIEFLKPEYVFIDYLQLINTSNRKNRSEELETVVKELKNIAQKNKCIIFIASQLSRALETRIDKRPLLSDLRGSRAIENISDIVIFIHREEYYHYINEEEYAYNKGKAEIIVAKNNCGLTAITNLLFRASIMKFLEPITCDEF